jgi:hypothetical protein
MYRDTETCAYIHTSPLHAAQITACIHTPYTSTYINTHTQVASFDWATSDMHLVLVRGGGDAPLGQEMMRSNESLAVDKDSSFETLSTLPLVTLTRGTYTLRLSDVFFPELRSMVPRRRNGMCVRFALSVDLVTLSDESGASSSSRGGASSDSASSAPANRAAP